MIFDDFKNFDLYDIDETVKNFILNIDPNISTGRHIISDKAYINIDEYKTRDDSEIKLEAHRKYIDIQYLITGKECMGYGIYKNFKSIKNYDTNKDVEFLKGEKYNYINLEEGEFIIFYPNDVHAPMLRVDKAEKIKKVIIIILL